MTLFQAFILGAIQGLTEFLPISSSGHLVLAETLMKLPAEGLRSFDISLHFGTLLAIIVYFWNDIVDLWNGFWAFVFNLFRKHKKLDDKTKSSQNLLLQLILATIPAVIVTLLFSDWFDKHFQTPFRVALFMIIVGLLLFVAEYVHSKVKERKIGYKEAIILGLAQCFALMPGVSRSGITISAGIAQGVKRDEAARFSFLMGAFAIAGATVFALYEVFKGKYLMPATDILWVGVGSSFAFSLMAIAFLMAFLRKYTLHIFGIYRVIAGFVVLYLLQFTTVFLK